MKTTTSDTYRVSQRVLLTRGMRFRATGGPLIRLSDGTKVPLTASGPFTFLAHCKRGKCEWIDALDKQGCYAPLHIAGRRRKVTPTLITRPYRITSTIRKKGTTG